MRARPASSCLLHALAPLLIVGLSAVGCRSSGAQSAAPAVLDNPQRSAEDRARDPASKPEVILDLLALEPGDRVLDFLTGGGYFAQLLAYVVGPEGRVLAHNNAAYRKWVGPNIGDRFADLGLAQVTLYDRELDSLGLAPDSLDGALMVATYHDLYFVDEENDWPAVDAGAVMADVAAALRPGARLVVVDHMAAEGQGKLDASSLHRIERGFAIDAWQRQGLRLVDSSDALLGGRDDLTTSVFDPSVRGQTDRFILVFERPAAD